MLMPMARDRERNIWPEAVFRTSKKLLGVEKGVRSGLNMKAYPSFDPGWMATKMMMTTRITARAGMTALLNRSMPPWTPPMTTTMAMRRKMP